MPQGNDRFGVSCGLERMQVDVISGWKVVTADLVGFRRNRVASERIQEDCNAGHRRVWRADRAGFVFGCDTNISASASLSSCCGQVHGTDRSELVTKGGIGVDRFRRGGCPDWRVRPVFVGRAYRSRAIRGEFAYNLAVVPSGFAELLGQLPARHSGRNVVSAVPRASRAHAVKAKRPLVASRDSIEP